MSTFKDFLNSPELVNLYNQACNSGQGFEDVWEGYVKEQFPTAEGYKLEERLLLHDYYSFCDNLKVTCITRDDCPLVVLWIKQDVGDIDKMGRVTAAMTVNDAVSEWKIVHKNALVTSGARCATGYVRTRVLCCDGSGVYDDPHDDMIPYELCQLPFGMMYEYLPSWDVRFEAALVQEQVDYIKKEMERYIIGYRGA